MSDTPITDAALANARYMVDDELVGKRAEYDVGKIRAEMAKLERRLRELERPGMVMVPEKVVKFLLGEGELEGVAYGDPHPTKNAQYWWRLYLRKAMIAAREEEQ